jgi:hypothetical protein
MNIRYADFHPTIANFLIKIFLKISFKQVDILEGGYSVFRFYL